VFDTVTTAETDAHGQHRTGSDFLAYVIFTKVTRPVKTLRYALGKVDCS